MRMEGPLFSADLSPPSLPRSHESEGGPAQPCRGDRLSLSEMALSTDPGAGSEPAHQPACFLCLARSGWSTFSPEPLPGISHPVDGWTLESIWHQFPQLLLFVHVTGDLWDEKKAWIRRCFLFRILFCQAWGLEYWWPRKRLGICFPQLRTSVMGRTLCANPAVTSGEEQIEKVLLLKVLEPRKYRGSPH